MANATEEDLLTLTQRLLDCIAKADWATYQDLCDPTLTAFEPEGLGQRIEGMAFHQYYFQLGGTHGQHQTLLCNPHVRLMGEVAVVTYVRLNQRLGSERAPFTSGFEETRVWQRQNGQWKHVHFHRSPLPANS